MNPDPPTSALAPTADSVHALVAKCASVTLKQAEELPALLAKLGTEQQSAIVHGLDEYAARISCWRDRLLERLSLDTEEFPVGRGRKSISQILSADSPVRRAVIQWRSDWKWDKTTTAESRAAVRAAFEAEPRVLTRPLIRSIARKNAPPAAPRKRKNPAGALPTRQPEIVKLLVDAYRQRKPPDQGAVGNGIREALRVIDGRTRPASKSRSVLTPPAWWEHWRGAQIDTWEELPEDERKIMRGAVAALWEHVKTTPEARTRKRPKVRTGTPMDTEGSDR